MNAHRRDELASPARWRSSIAAITFDLDDTLYDNEPVIEAAERSLIEYMRTRHPATATLDRAAWQLVKRQIARERPMLEHDVTAWRHATLREGLRRCGHDAGAAHAAADAAMAFFLDERHRIAVPAQTHRVLAALARRLPLAVITNGNADVGRLGLAGFFSGVWAAGGGRRQKPAADLFLAAAAGLGLPPARILHVGDHPVNDVGGAIAAGFRACWLNVAAPSVAAAAAPDLEIQRLEELLPLVA